MWGRPDPQTVLLRPVDVPAQPGCPRILMLSYFGSGSGTWFIDMDTSGFVGQLLTISVWGLTYPSYKDDLGRTVKVNLAAVMQPK